MPNQLKSIKPYAVLLMILVIAYLPVSSFYFGMKNDAFSDNFPNKIFIAEAISNGYLPLWNPYINFGFPVYADMGVAFYNPITWLFAIIGYNAYTLTAEVLLYIYLGGVFMFRLGNFLKFDKRICVAMAAMYMCSGFYTGSLQYINFLTAAAFLPLVLQTLLQLFSNPSFKSSFFLAVACYFVVAGGHPAIPIAMVYCIAAVILLLFTFTPMHRNNVKHILLCLMVSLTCLVFFYLPALYSYISILPYYGRNAIAKQVLYTNAGFSFSSYISFLFPFSTITNSGMFGTDVAMRNGFFSVTGFVLVLLCFKSKQPLARVFLIAALFMLLLSAAGATKEFIFDRLPLLGYVRYNGEYRVFSILCFCIIAGFGLCQLAKGDVALMRRFKIILDVVAGLCTAIIVIIALHLNVTELSNLVHQTMPVTQKIKDFLAGPFRWFLLISAVLALIVSLLSILALKRNWFNTLLVIIISDVVINSIIYLPVTGVGQVTLKNIQAVYNTSSEGIPIPALTPVNKIDTLDKKTTGLVGDISYYNKLIGTTRLTDYPSFFSTTAAYFNNKPMVEEVSKRPFLFVGHDIDTGADISVQKFSPERIEIKVIAPRDDTLVFLQNNYKFWHAELNGRQTKIETAYTTFMSVKINKGVNTVVFYYRDSWLGICLLISAAAFFICIVIVARQNAHL